MKQACKLYTLGANCGEALRKASETGRGKNPCDSPQMKVELAEFQAADEEWGRLEQEHLEYRKQFEIDP